MSLPAFSEISMLEDLLAENPRSVLYSHLVRAQVAAGRKDQAISTLEHCLTYHPTDVDGRILLAKLLEEQQRPAQARQVLQEAVLQLRTYLPLFNQLSLHLANQGQDQEAEKVLELTSEFQNLLQNEILSSGASQSCSGDGVSLPSEQANNLLLQLEALGKAARQRDESSI